jgi:hypothetical protein
MGKQKRNRWERIKGRTDLDRRAVDAYARLMEAERRVYELWEQRGGEKNWIGEALEAPIEAEDGLLWIAGLGEKVAALGGRLELVAVFDRHTDVLVREPGPLEPEPPAKEKKRKKG